MRILAKQNREIIMINARNTQNENDAEKILLEVPEQYEDFNKKIVFITDNGIVWDIIQNNEYLIKKAITKYKQVDFYIWLTKGDLDFRTQTKTLKFYDNVDASEEITDEEIGRVNTVINILEEEITKVEDLEIEINGKLEEIDTAIDDVNTAIDEVQNLDLDAEKVNKTTTITLTKRDSTTKTVQIDDGISLQFDWQGTSLGIKTENQSEYTYVNLQGVQGPVGPQGDPFTIKKTYSSIAEMNADFNNMQLGDYVMIASTVEVEDNAKLYTRGESQWIFITDFSGATGIRGETGLTPNIQIGTVTRGSSFNVTRTGTNENPILNFTLVKGDKGDQGNQGVKGDTGNGIATIAKTATVGLVDTYTITYTDGNTTIFTVTNGEDGEVTQAQLDKVQDQVNKMKANQLTNTATGLLIDLDDSADDYIRSLNFKRHTTQKTTVGTNRLNNEMENGTLDSNGMPMDSSTGVIRTKNFSEVESNTQYTLSNDKNYAGYIYEYDENYSLVNSYTGGPYQTGPVTITTTSTTKYIKGRGISNQNDLTVKYMLNTGSTVESYEPYTGGKPSPSPDYPQTIKNVGDNGSITEVIENSDGTEQQTLSFPMQQNQKLLGYTADDGIHQEYTTIVFDGSNDENWNKGNSPIGASVQFYIPKPNNMFVETGATALSKILCSHFANQEVVNGMRVASYLSFYPSTDLNITTVTEWRAWLSTHNITVQYQLVEEDIERYSQEQQTAHNQIQELETYKTVTHIYSEDETSANMDLEYTQDTKTYIDNKIETLTDAIVSLGGNV